MRKNVLKAMLVVFWVTAFPGAALADTDADAGTGTGTGTDPSTDIVGGWTCYLEGKLSLLINFNSSGTFSANSLYLSISTIHGVWKQTGANTFRSKEIAFIYGADGAAEYVQKITSDCTMPDNDTLNADLHITITDLEDNIIKTDTLYPTCTRITIDD